MYIVSDSFLTDICPLQRSFPLSLHEKHQNKLTMACSFLNIYVYIMDQWIGMGVSCMEQLKDKAKLNMEKMNG